MTVSNEVHTEIITPEEALRGEDARYAAQVADDFAAMEELFADDLVYTHATAEVDNKASYIELMRSGEVKYRAFRRSDTQVRTYGSIAIITGRGDFDVTGGGKDKTVPLLFTSVWVKRSGKVQFVSWQATGFPA